MSSIAPKMFRTRIIPQTLRFKQPAGTSRGIYNERKVWYIYLVSSLPNGAYGVGECAPLPGLSIDDMEECRYITLLRRFLDDFERTGFIDLEAMRPYPSMLFGLETAYLSYRSSLAQNHGHFFDNAFSRGEVPISINGLVWMGNYNEMQQRLEEKLASGFTCVKLKIGAIDFESEIQLLNQVRNRFGKDTIELRVDANGAFSPNDAFYKLERLSKFHIHSIEQPIAAKQYEQMAHLCRHTPIPIALDEELIGVHTKEEKENLLHHLQPQYIVLKPSLHGGFHGAKEWMMEAKKKGIGYWTTSALESNIGLRAISEWCYEKNYVDNDTIPESEILHQGLGTGLLYNKNVENVALSLEGALLWSKIPAQRKIEKQFVNLKEEWCGDTKYIQVSSSGSTGIPKIIHATKQQYERSALRTCKFLGISQGKTALVCLPLEYIAGQMMVIRSLVWNLRPIVVAPTSRPFKYLHQSPHFAALTPMQVFETLKNPREARLLRGVQHLIIGGGAIPPSVESQLQTFPHNVWSTYGMAETLSNIALRRINGRLASSAYIPLEGVQVLVDDSNRIIINDNYLNICNIVTNDIAKINPDGTFLVLGRFDNVICSGGMKWLPELIELKLSELPFNFQITSVPDEKLGNAVAIIYTSKHSEEEVAKLCRQLIKGADCPRYIIKVNKLPITATGKPARREAQQLAKKALFHQW